MAVATPVPSSPGTDPVEEQPVQKASDLDPRLLVDDAGLRGYGQAFARRLRSGELGSLPVLIGLVVIWLYFYSQQSAFLSSENLYNLALQMMQIGLISVGVVMVLLLGEVDLSAGSLSGLGSCIIAVLIVREGLTQPLGILLGIAVAALIGAAQGWVRAVLGVPSFIVTLAGLLAWQGLQLAVLGPTGTVTLSTGVVHSLAFANYPASTGYALVAIAALVYAAAQGWEFTQRRKAGLRPRPPLEIGVRVALMVVILSIVVAVLNHYKGVPFALVLLLVVVVLFDLLIRRTRYGRHVLAVGGNEEAARRAGISITFIRISVFAIAGAMAAAGGLLDLAYQESASQASGGSVTLLYAIAAVVIGGTSLFGGRGSAWSALLGTLVITSINNGMALLSYSPSTRYMVTGAVLLIAATLDAVSRRGQRASGRR